MKLALIRWCWFLLPVTLFAAIDWGITGTGSFEIRRGFPVTNIVEFGLRDDGVVVWREIKQQPGWVTNSPAEKPLPAPAPQWWTNIMSNVVVPMDYYWTNAP